MTVCDIKTNEIISTIDHLTQHIIDKLNKYELDDINLIIEERFVLLKKLIEDGKKEPELQQYLTEVLERDQNIMQLIRKEQEKINNVILNINNLNDYLDVSVS